MSLEITWPLRAPKEMSLRYRICLLFTYSICYWEVCIHFSGGEEKTNFLLGYFARGEFTTEMEISTE